MAETVYFVTNRRREDGAFIGKAHERGPEHLFVGEGEVGLSELDAGRAENKVANAEHVGRVTVYETGGDDPDLAPGFGQLVATLKQDVVKNGHDLIIYLHGYDTDFKQALWYGAQVKLQYNRVLNLARRQIAENGERPIERVAVLVFSWPSIGKSLAYLQDYNRCKDRHFGRGLATLLGQITGAANGSWPRNAHLMVQSMGSRVLEFGLQDFIKQAETGGRLPRVFDTITFSGADSDADVFEAGRPLERLPEIAGEVALYHNKQDRLGLYSMLLHFRRRLSRSGLRKPAAAPQVSALQVSRVAGGRSGSPTRTTDPRGHFYMRMNPGVIGDALFAFAGAMSDKIPGRRVLGPDNAFLIDIDPDDIKNRYP